MKAGLKQLHNTFEHRNHCLPETAETDLFDVLLISVQGLTQETVNEINKKVNKNVLD